MILRFPENPFKNFEPGGSPSNRWTDTPIVYLGGSPYVAVFYWDLDSMKKNQSKETLAHFCEHGVVGQSIVRATDGEEFYARILEDGTTDIFNTGFFGPKFSAPIKTQQPKTTTVLKKFHQQIVKLYEGHPDVHILEPDLETIATLDETYKYLFEFHAWNDELWVAELEIFFASAV